MRGSAEGNRTQLKDSRKSKKIQNMSPEKRLNIKKIQGNQRQGGECVSCPSPGGAAGGGAKKTQLGTTQ
jgi:hypothetical protein